MEKNYFTIYQEMKNVKKAALIAAYDRGGVDTAIKYQDKKPIKDNEKAARVLHYYKLNAARYVLKKINAGGLESLTALEYYFIKDLYINSISIGTGKLKGINSISTAVFLNDNCIKNAAIQGGICAHCYAARYTSFRPALARKLEINTVLYCSYIVPSELLPEINAQYFRIESFGDIMNATQQKNYFGLCEKNPRVSFAQWSKNPHITAAALKDGYKKPVNLQYVYSLIMENSADDIARGAMALYKFIDKCFIVYDPETAKNTDINCGGRSCMACLNCYNSGGADIVREKRK